SHRSEDCENAGGGRDEEPVQRAAGMFGFAEELAAVHAGLDEVCGNAVAVAFAKGCFFPAGLLLTGGGRKRDGGDSEHHKKRAADHCEIDRRTAAVQLPENKNSPKQAPELIRIGKRNAAADADIFCGVLLEDIADDPNEAAEHQPKNDSARAEQFFP